MSSAEVWARGYARQAGADFETWDKLQAIDSIPECHKLMFIQMACEKLSKAYLCKTGRDPSLLQASHAYLAKNLPIAIRHQIDVFRPSVGYGAWLYQHAKHLAREIELLSPAVRDGGRRPDNCEYPWEDQTNRVHVPLDWTFTTTGLLLVPAGRTFLKLIREAINRFLD